MAEIKAIETEYNGYKFRSRLEARWAVFFDALGIEYQYETEGFEAPTYNGQEKVFYLPDFYLPKFNIYCEVKGTDKALKSDFDKIAFCIDFKATPISNGLLILGGIPNPETFGWGNIPMFSFLSWGEGIWHDFATFFVDHYNQKLSFIVGNEQILKTIFVYAEPWGSKNAPEMPEPTSVECRWTRDDLKSFDEEHDGFKKLKDAYKLARTARFEHGETPKIER